MPLQTMATPGAARRALVGFLAAGLSVLTFHAAAWFVLNKMGMMPPPYPMRPVPPFGIPLIASLAFWGALYGIPFGLAYPYLKGPVVLSGLGLGLVACLVGWFVVAPLKGGPPAGGSLVIPIMINGCWGVGVALLVPRMMRWSVKRRGGATPVDTTRN